MIERAKADLGQTQTINRTQYELELTAYQAVWAALLPVHRAAVALRPAFDRGLGDGETEDSRKKDRLKAFGDTFNPFSEAVWKHRPFYPAPVFEELNGLLRLIHGEAIEYQVFDQYRQMDYWEKAIANAKAINDQVDKVCDTIRNRLSAARVA
ncbi:MAG TPA: hypothetical protein VN602_12895 [Gemmatimonadaceae bacterium]|nr:hypothetical protein [Gemmatimonadaceae bacterium]